MHTSPDSGSDIDRARPLRTARAHLGPHLGMRLPESHAHGHAACARQLVGVLKAAVSHQRSVVPWELRTAVRVMT